MHSIGQLKRLRWAVRMVLTLGVAASVAANILHANPNPISQTIAAWPSLAFLLTVELVSRIPMHRPLMAAVRLAATAVIAGIAGWVSYWHMVDVAARFGESGDSAHLLPFTVDGLIVVASVSLVELAGRLTMLQMPTKVETQVVETLGGPVTVPAARFVEPVVELPATVTPMRGGPKRGRSGPQVSGPSNAGLNGSAVTQDTPTA
jgi:hypothetical protein